MSFLFFLNALYPEGQNYDYSQSYDYSNEEFTDYGAPDVSIDMKYMAIGEGSEDPLLDDTCLAMCPTPGYTKSVVNSQNTPEIAYLNDCECCMQISFKEQTKIEAKTWNRLRKSDQDKNLKDKI